MSFRGVYTALVTPFNDGCEIDYNSLENIVEKQIMAGVSGVVVCSTTGEGMLLTQNEKIKTAKFVQKIIKNRAKLIISMCEDNILTLFDDLRKFEKLSPDAYLLSLPYYVKPNFKGLVEFVKAFASKTKTPVVLYYAPHRSSQVLTIEQLKTLCTCSSNIVGIKDASGDLMVTASLCGVKPNFSVLCGNDDLVIPSIKLGAVGIVSVASNALPKKFVDIFKTKELYAAIYDEISVFVESLKCDINPVPIKFAMNCFGCCTSRVRLPLYELDSNKKTIIREAVSKLSKTK
ncbi:MAG: 4-hydroxy-tetrahydrodipicolinate synthase [Clostridia bacterium]|nr:4-hydroxy-tetrahydrodipicolinate synthase [Clostridia bacterium]